MRIKHKLGPLKLLYEHIITYPTPMNLSYAYNFGSLSGIILLIQIVTGILLAMHYVGHVDYAFNSVIHLMNDVPSGMIIRYTHANGASLFFTVVYLHILRSIYYNSGNQPREIVWLTGVIILLIMIIIAFIGYVLPWGQMSFWGATVITSLVTVLPIVGETIIHWLWGSFSIDNATLNRFYSLHYTLPFLLAGLSIFHISALHQYGSTNPLGISTQTSTVPFGIYYTSKDLYGLLILCLFFIILVFFYPEVLGHSDNLIPANPYSTPTHIVPEWYYLYLYAILRSITSKSIGVIAIALFFISLISMPFISNMQIGSPKFRIISERLFWFFVGNMCLLTYIGTCEITNITITMGKYSTIFLFLYLSCIYPFLAIIENKLYLSK